MGQPKSLTACATMGIGLQCGMPALTRKRADKGHFRATIFYCARNNRPALFDRDRPISGT